MLKPNLIIRDQIACIYLSVQVVQRFITDVAV